MLLDYDHLRRCRDEVEHELFLAANDPACNRFFNETQLTAVLLLLIRNASLFDSLLRLFQSRNLDGFHAVLRAFEENWNMAVELRLKTQNEKTTLWLAGDKSTYLASIPVLNKFFEGRGQLEPALGPDYGRLSNLYHPMRSAAMNSVGVALVRLHSEGADTMSKAAEDNDELRIPYALLRLIWLTLADDPNFINLPINPARLPLSVNFLKVDEHVQPKDDAE
jgi:hypothetical protein